MTEKDVIENAFGELIAIHLKKYAIHSDKNRDIQLIKNAEAIIDNLNKEDSNIVKMYIESIFDRMADEELCLYSAGLKDGFKFLSWISITDKGNL